MNIASKLISLFLLLFFIGCSTNTPQRIASEIDLTDAPKWVLKPPLNYDLSALGSAKIGKGGIGFARKLAVLRARTKIAKKISGLSSIFFVSFFENFTKEIGAYDDQTIDLISEFSSKLFAKQSVKARIKDSYISKSGKIFVLLSASKYTAEDIAKKIEYAIEPTLKKSFKVLCDEVDKFHEYDSVNKKNALSGKCVKYN